MLLSSNMAYMPDNQPAPEITTRSTARSESGVLKQPSDDAGDDQHPEACLVRVGTAGVGSLGVRDVPGPLHKSAPLFGDDLLLVDHEVDGVAARGARVSVLLRDSKGHVFEHRAEGAVAGLVVVMVEVVDSLLVVDEGDLKAGGVELRLQGTDLLSHLNARRFNRADVINDGP